MEVELCLAKVREHSQWLSGVGESGEEMWLQSDWKGAFESLFLAEDPSRSGGHQDDMLFFVNAPGEAAQENEDIIFVRRWMPALPATIKADWRETVYLNLICHTQFTLSVAICSYSALRDRTKPGPRTLLRVVRPVYASPSMVRVDLKTSKAEAPKPSWPDIYFAVYDYGDAFEEMVISDLDHCLVVELRASGGLCVGGRVGGAGAASGRPVGTEAPAGASGAVSGAAPEGQPQLSLFSGMVSSDAMQNAFRKVASGVRFRSPRRERVVMSGPMGRGRVEVAVTEPSAEGADAGRGVARAAGVVAGAARAVVKGLVAGGGAPQGLPAPCLQCCVMCVCMPWDLLMKDVLFKQPTFIAN